MTANTTAEVRPPKGFTEQINKLDGSLSDARSIIRTLRDALQTASDRNATGQFSAHALDQTLGVVGDLLKNADAASTAAAFLVTGHG